jgi:parvulin-like peptidyl-prolyl isomerase
MNPPRFGQPDEVYFPRAMFLYVLGACIGLGIAGYGLFTSQGTVTRGVPPEDVALVNQRPVLRSDFITQLETETGLKFEQSTRADQLRVLTEMVNEELLVQRGLELDFAETDQDTRNALVAIVNQQMIADVTTSTPTEQQLRDWYDTHREAFSTEGTMTACDLVIKLPPTATAQRAAALPRAQAAATALRAGQPLTAVLARSGMENANQCEDNLWFAAKIHLGDALYAQARELKAGAVTDPVALPDGLHVLQMLKNTPPVPMSFEVAHEKVEGDYKAEREARITEATMRFLHQRSRIMVAGDYSGDYKP